MIEAIFGILNSLGFHHPVHPALTHLSMGLVMGGFAFALAAYLFKKQELFRTSYHCSILALIGIPPTVILGIMDWQYTLGGDWLPAIKIKFVAAGLLSVFLIVLIRIGKEGEKSPLKVLVFHGLALLSAITIGFWGGDLIFG